MSIFILLAVSARCKTRLCEPEGSAKLNIFFESEIGTALALAKQTRRAEALADHEHFEK
jgi:hypothetical protein